MGRAMLRSVLAASAKWGHYDADEPPVPHYLRPPYFGQRKLRAATSEWTTISFCAEAKR
jgi:hypothetical protein